MALHPGALAIFENNVGVSDAVLLDPLTEDAFIQNIKERFGHDQIYVSIYSEHSSLCSRRASRVANEVSSTVENMIKEK